MSTTFHLKPHRRTRALSRLWTLILLLGASAVLAVVIASCRKSPTAPALTRTDAQMNFLKTAASAPPLANPTVSFWAKRGRDAEATIYYRPHAGRTDSTKFLVFKLNAASLAIRPDGRPFAAGDSVLITITVTDPTRLIVSFSPSGLKFSPDAPAQLEMSYLETDQANSSTEIQQQIRLWVQDAPGGLWTQVQSSVFLDLDEAEGAIFGFSGYSLSY